jgi:hypothetical protein
MAHRTSHPAALAGAATLMAVLAVACSGRNDTVNNDRRVQAGGERGKNEMVKVEGCVQEAPGPPGRQYVLADVVVPEPETQPQGQETMAHGPLIPAGSWVRLEPGSENLKNSIGQRVMITGEVVDSGDNTMGRKKREGMDLHDKFELASRDASSNPERALPPATVPPATAHSNGDAPKIAVEKVSKLADSCRK